MSRGNLGKFNEKSLEKKTAIYIYRYIYVYVKVKRRHVFDVEKFNVNSEWIVMVLKQIPLSQEQEKL